MFFFSVHKTEEDSAGIAVNVYLKNQFKRLRKPVTFDFAELRVKGRAVMGNIVTKNPVERIARIMPSAAATAAETPAGDNAPPPAPADAPQAPPAPQEAPQQAPEDNSPVPPMEDTQGTFNFDN